MTSLILDGVIGNKKAKRFVATLRSIPRGSSVRLQINSDGGFYGPAILMLAAIRDVENHYGVSISTHIERAESASAVLALQAGPVASKTMNRNGFLNFHLGSLVLESSDWNPQTGIIADPIRKEYEKYRKLLDETLDRYGLSSDPKTMAELYGRNWLKVPAQKCLELGMVSRLV